MKILPSNIKIENPCDDEWCAKFKDNCSLRSDCHSLIEYKAKLELLSQCIEIEPKDKPDKAGYWWCEIRGMTLSFYVIKPELWDKYGGTWTRAITPEEMRE